MDPVSAALIAAINIDAGVGEPVQDASNALKGAFQKKIAENSVVFVAIPVPG